MSERGKRDASERAHCEGRIDARPRAHVMGGEGGALQEHVGRSMSLSGAARGLRQVQGNTLSGAVSVG